MYVRTNLYLFVRVHVNIFNALMGLSPYKLTLIRIIIINAYSGFLFYSKLITSFCGKNKNKCQLDNIK